MSRRRRPTAGHGSGVRYWSAGPPVVDPRCPSPRLLSFIGVTDKLSRSKTDKREVFECLKDIIISSQILRVGKLMASDPAGRCRDQADDLPCKTSRLPRRDQEQRRQDWLAINRIDATGAGFC
jgi:hypothetical protein